MRDQVKISKVLEFELGLTQLKKLSHDNHTRIVQAIVNYTLVIFIVDVGYQHISHLGLTFGEWIL